MHLRTSFSAIVAFSFGCLLLATPTVGEDWPQWLGPHRNAKGHEAGLLQSWPEGGPPRVWSFEDCGVGYGGPAIVEGRVYILGGRGEVEQLICLDADSGGELWAANVGALYENDWGNGPRSTPTIENGRAYVIAAKGAVSCVDLNSGDLVWQTSMVDELGGKIPVWGYSESPLIVGDHLFCTPGGSKGAIAALNKNTGEVVWQATDLTDDAHYSSIVTQTIGDKTTLVQLLVSQLVGVDLETGEVLWSEGWPGRVAIIPTPIITGSQVFVSSGYGIGCMLVDVADDFSATKVYENKVMKCKHDGMVLLDGNVFGYSDGVGWMCQDLESGEQVWRERSELGKGSIGFADGRFYCLSEDEGEVVLIGATSDGWEEHGRFKLDPQTEIRKDRGKIWTHPVVSNGQLYLRDQNFVHCYDVRDAGRTASTFNPR